MNAPGIRKAWKGKVYIGVSSDMGTLRNSARLVELYLETWAGVAAACLSAVAFVGCPSEGVVEAQRIELLNAQGHLRARLLVADEDGRFGHAGAARLQLAGAEREELVDLHEGATPGLRISFPNKNGLPRCSTGLGETGVAGLFCSSASRGIVFLTAGEHAGAERRGVRLGMARPWDGEKLFEAP